MRNRSLEIDCLKRYQDKLGLHAMIDLMEDEKLVNDESFKDLSRATEYPERIHDILSEALKKDEIILFSFDWVILPIERIKVTITTKRQHREFSYDSPNV